MSSTISEMIASQLIFWGIVITSIFIYLEFKRSVDGKLRLLIMELFLAKIWCYGTAGLYYICWDFGYFHDWNSVLLRVIYNAPMFWVMLRLYIFIKNK